MMALVRMPTIRQPVLPVKIDDLVDAAGAKEEEA
jgi:hypothetical protein